LKDTQWYKVISQQNEADFQSNRVLGLGGSDASSILGHNPWMSITDLYDSKTGNAKEFITNSAVEFGNDAESLLHDLFYLQYPQYTKFNTKGISLISTEKEFIRANIDGFMQDADGKYGVLEIKTVQNGFQKWKDGQVPMNYFCQLLHYMYVTNADFAIMYALFNMPYADDCGRIRKILIERDTVKDSIDYLIEKETDFWENNVLKGVRPKMIISL
jgi:putative phage-type endonuclease